MPDPKLSTTNKATVVATTIGHRPYYKKFDTCGEGSGITSRKLAQDRPISRTVCLFDLDTDGDTD